MWCNFKAFAIILCHSECYLIERANREVNLRVKEYYTENNAHNWISNSRPIQLIIVKEKYFLSICVDTSTLINWPKLGKSLQIHFMSRIRGDAESPNDWLTWTSVFVAASSLYLGTMAALRGSFTSSFPLLDSTFTCTGASPERRPLTKS